MIVYIYSISHPLTGDIVYIGKTKNFTERKRKHLSYKRQTKLSRWIKGIKNKGLIPCFNIIEEVDVFNWQEREIALIKEYGKRCQLLNMTTGGEGGNTMGGRKLTQEQKDKISKANSGMKRPDNAIRESVLAKKVDMFDLDMNYIMTFDSIRKAAKHIGRDDIRIQKMCNGNSVKTINHVGGYKFRYSDKIQAKQKTI